MNIELAILIPWVAITVGAVGLAYTLAGGAVAFGVLLVIGLFLLWQNL
ncbi:hypothetical protein ACGYLO_16700 [Sulfitobacter sp. 1A13353]